MGITGLRTVTAFWACAVPRRRLMTSTPRLFRLAFSWPFSYIFFSSFTFPGSHCLNFLLHLTRLYFYQRKTCIPVRYAPLCGMGVGEAATYAPIYTEKFFRNIVKSIWNQILIFVFGLIWNQTDVHLVPNQSENGNYNLISDWFDKISKIFQCLHVCPLKPFLGIFQLACGWESCLSGSLLPGQFPGEVFLQI